MTWRGSAASIVSGYRAVSVFRVVANEGGDEDYALQKPCGRCVGRSVIADIFCSFVYVFMVKFGKLVGGRVFRERITFDEAISIAKEARLTVS